MSNLLLLHGINLNALGKRDPTHYGSLTLERIETLTRREAAKYGYGLISYQSNHEGDLVDKLQKETSNCVGIIINAGAFTHYSYGLYDALLDSQLPAIEVHLSNIEEREAWRKQSVLARACIGVIYGKKDLGYQEAVKTLIEYLQHENKSSN